MYVSICKHMYMLQQPLFLSEIFNFHSFTLQFYDHTGIRPKNKLYNLFVVMFEPPSLFAESTKSVHICFSVHTVTDRKEIVHNM